MSKKKVNGFCNYKSLWQHILQTDYKDKYTHSSGLSGGGGNYPVYDMHVNLLDKESLLVPPKCNKLIHSVEHLRVPKGWSLLVLNKSTNARVFDDYSRATYIDSGFEGYLTIEYSNDSWWFRRILNSQPVLQVLAVPHTFMCDGYDGKYQDQKPEPVKAIYK